MRRGRRSRERAKVSCRITGVAISDPISAGGTVSMTGGSPSLARRRLTVILTVLVNGSAISSHTPSRRSPTVSTRPWAASRRSRTANSLGVSARGLPARVATRRAVSTAEVAVDQGGRQRGGGARLERLDAGHQLGEGERFGQVVIGAQAEALHSVVDRSVPRSASSTRLRRRSATSVRQTSSPWTRGRSRSSTMTS